MIECRYFGKCSGCSWSHFPREKQEELKIQDLRGRFDLSGVSCPDVGEWIFNRPAEADFRTRLDFTFQRLEGGEIRFGLYGQESQELVDIESCAVATSSLNVWLSQFREHLKTMPSVIKGSVRLRSNVQSKLPGVWLDFSNDDIFSLLKEQSWIEALGAISLLEVGQHRKTLFKKPDGSLGLQKTLNYAPWFQTFDAETGAEISLQSTVAGFTQPGVKTNQAVIQTMTGFLKDVPADICLEYGCGGGNLTLPLLSMGWEVGGMENDPYARESLDLNLKKHPEFRERFQWVHPRHLQDALSQVQGVIVDPPRSGLGGFLDEFAVGASKNSNIEFLLYVSCFPESFTDDAVKFAQSGYSIQKLAIVDQFPHTPHYEVIALLKR